MTTREENHEYALAIIKAKNAEIRDLQAAIHKLTSALIEAGVERSTLRAERDALRTVIWEAHALASRIIRRNQGAYTGDRLATRRIVAALDAALAVQPTTGERA